ncbi:hypothetical protein [Nocardioides donggukensis]|uniref:Uncharacterized protein n=1 Tax=Nocardioides donggukensis TaxID=2774019 RepID=A0A927K6R7_9ACTN|nr:hypothetical protein [Nocardioides donggukensis]MBD8870903.1 hypothetical protein [Nocardioides donggukensis]
MFVHQCTACQKRQLIFMSQVTGMATVDGGLAVAFTCWCGSEQASLLDAPATEEPVTRPERESVAA